MASSAGSQGNFQWDAQHARLGYTIGKGTAGAGMETLWCKTAADCDTLRASAGHPTRRKPTAQTEKGATWWHVPVPHTSKLVADFDHEFGRRTSPPPTQRAGCRSRAKRPRPAADDDVGNDDDDDGGSDSEDDGAEGARNEADDTDNEPNFSPSPPNSPEHPPHRPTIPTALQTSTLREQRTATAIGGPAEGATHDSVTQALDVQAGSAPSSTALVGDPSSSAGRTTPHPSSAGLAGPRPSSASPAINACWTLPGRAGPVASDVGRRAGNETRDGNFVLLAAVRQLASARAPGNALVPLTQPDEHVAPLWQTTQAIAATLRVCGSEVRAELAAGLRNATLDFVRAASPAHLAWVTSQDSGWSTPLLEAFMCALVAARPSPPKAKRPRLADEARVLGFAPAPPADPPLAPPPCVQVAASAARSAVEAPIPGVRRADALGRHLQPSFDGEATRQASSPRGLCERDEMASMWRGHEAAGRAAMWQEGGAQANAVLATLFSHAERVRQTEARWCLKRQRSTIDMDESMETVNDMDDRIRTHFQAAMREVHPGPETPGQGNLLALNAFAAWQQRDIGALRVPGERAPVALKCLCKQVVALIWGADSARLAEAGEWAALGKATRPNFRLQVAAAAAMIANADDNDVLGPDRPADAGPDDWDYGAMAARAAIVVLCGEVLQGAIGARPHSWAQWGFVYRLRLMFLSNVLSTVTGPAQCDLKRAIRGCFGADAPGERPARARTGAQNAAGATDGSDVLPLD